MLPYNATALKRLSNRTAARIRPNLRHPLSPKGTIPRLFSTLAYIDELCRTVQSRKIGSEDDLRLFQYFMVEDFVTTIISVLSTNYEDSGDWAGQGVFFDNHTNSLIDLAEDVQERLGLANPHPTPEPTYAD